MKRIYMIALWLIIISTPVVFSQRSKRPKPKEPTSHVSNLTRRSAAQLIMAKLFGNGPSPEFDFFGLYSDGFCFGYRHDPCQLSDMSAEDRALQSEGLVTVALEGRSSRLSLTEKGKQYAVGNPYYDNRGTGFDMQWVKVIKSTLEFSEITGIAETGWNVATVDYTVSRKVTPFGRLSGLVPSTFAARPINFRKYDDGWRIEKFTSIYP